MRHSIEIAKNDLRIFLVNRGNLISLLLVPVIMTLIIGLVSGDAFGSGHTYLIVDVLDRDQSPLSAQFLDALRDSNSALLLCPMDNDAQDSCELGELANLDAPAAASRLNDSISLATIEIPAGFGVQTQAFTPVTITYTSLEDFTAPGYIRQAVDAAVQRVNSALVAAQVGSGVLQQLSGDALEGAALQRTQQAIYARAGQLWDAVPTQVTYIMTGEEQGSLSDSLRGGLGQSVPGMGSMFVMFTVFGGMSILIVERKEWTLPRVATMPISRSQLLGGKILSRVSLGLLQYGVVFAIGLLAGMNFGDDLLALFLVAISFTLSVTALSFALGSRLDNEAQAAGLSLLLALILAPLGGAWWPLETMPEFMQVIAHISPVAWAMDGYNTLIFQSGGLQDVLLPVGVLLGATVIFFWLGIRRFRYV